MTKTSDAASHVSDRSAPTSWRRVKNTLLTLAILACISACAFFTSNVDHTDTSTWRHLPAVKQVSDHLKMAGTVVPSVTKNVQSVGPAGGFEKSEPFRAFLPSVTKKVQSVGPAGSFEKSEPFRAFVPSVTKKVQGYGPAGGFEKSEAFRAFVPSVTKKVQSVGPAGGFEKSEPFRAFVPSVTKKVQSHGPAGSFEKSEAFRAFLPSVTKKVQSYGPAGGFEKSEAFRAFVPSVTKKVQGYGPVGGFEKSVTFRAFVKEKADNTTIVKTGSFEKSEAFQAFVKQKVGNTTTVEEYIASVRTYLLNFRSPMIRERPEEYSWSETEKERAQAKTKDEAPPKTKIKKIAWYNAPGFMKRVSSLALFGHCPVKDCQLSWNGKDHAQADVVLFHGAPVRKIYPKGHPGQVYVFNVMESPVWTSSHYSDSPWNLAFNWTWNYRTDSDIFSPVQYLKRPSAVPSMDQLRDVVRQKTKPVSWISSHCIVQSRRDQYVKRLKQTIRVDHYGRCGKLICDGKTPNCSTMLNDYFYYLSFENSMCQDYVTEKFYKTFFQDIHVLAVVRGGANYSRFFPEGTFIDAESFASPEELGQYLLDLSQDEARYVDMLWRKAHFVYHERGSVDAYCQLCYRAHHVERFAKTYPDLYGWYHKDQCKPARTFRLGLGFAKCLTAHLEKMQRAWVSVPERNAGELPRNNKVSGRRT